MNQAFFGKHQLDGIESTVTRKKTTQPTFSVCVLLYGDYPDLAERCLESIALLSDEKVEIRIGMNAVSETTRRFALNVFEVENQRGRNVLLYDSTTNRG